MRNFSKKNKNFYNWIRRYVVWDWYRRFLSFCRRDGQKM